MTNKPTPDEAVSPLAIDFDNTEIAFRSRSDAELRKALVLFRSFNYPTLLAAGPKLANFAYALRLPITPIVRWTMFDYFCGGVTIEDSLRTVTALGRYGVRSVLDYSVEGLGREKDFDATVTETLRTIEKAKSTPHMPFAVFKVTGLGRFDLLAKVSAGTALSAGEKAEFDRVRGRVRRLCVATRDAGRRMLIDAEETWIQPAIDALAVDMMRELNKTGAVVYNTLQMYRSDRLAEVHRLHRLGKAEGFVPGIKLVRGAYMEKERARAASLGQPSPIQPDKAATDRDFDAAVAYCVEHVDEMALFAGSHNERSNRLLAEHVVRRGLRRDDPRIEFSQLFGMSDHLTYNLAEAGFNVSKYVPYGPVKAVIPYLARRAQENSSVKGQATRELQLIERELRRRAGTPATAALKAT